jgi:hypothetical protein
MTVSLASGRSSRSGSSSQGSKNRDFGSELYYTWKKLLDYSDMLKYSQNVTYSEFNFSVSLSGVIRLEKTTN